MRFTPVVRSTENPSVNLPPARLFEALFNEWPFRTFLTDRTEAWKPAVDILERDGNLVLKAELPGMDEKNLDVQLEGNTLTLKGDKKIENQKEPDNYYQAETFHGSFSRSFTLPETVDMERINAEYKNGVLTITLPQRPETKPRVIPVAVH